MIYFRGGLVGYACEYTQQEIFDFGMLVISLGQQHRFQKEQTNHE